jgi:2-methylisocitrate lyase-like PEP mutase family enzyme
VADSPTDESRQAEPGPRRTLRDRLDTGDLVVAPGATSPLTARIIERLGFPAIYLGGNAIGLDLAIGQPLVTLTETLDAVSKVRSRVDVPIIVDVGAGFGAPSNMRRTVRECERLGADALQIDDQPYPKSVNYHRGRSSIAPLRVACDRLRTATAARTRPGTLIIARTDALRVTGSADAVLERCAAYAAAGADVLMILDLTPAGLTDLTAKLPSLPIAWIGGVSDAGPSLAELSAAGFRLAVYPFTTVGTVVTSVTATWTALRDHGQLPSPAGGGWALGEALRLAAMEQNWEIEDLIDHPGTHDVESE